MQARPFDFMSDYPDIYKWWQKWKWEPIAPQYLPPTGIMVENNDEKVCCCFIYRTDSQFCIIDYFIINPFSKKCNRIGCVDFLTQEALKKAKEIGFTVANTFASHSNLLKTLEKNGYVKHAELIKMIKVL